MAGPIDWNHGLMLLLLTTTCVPLTSSDSSACPSEVLEDTTVDIKPAITNGATGQDPLHVSTEAKCLQKCCLANTASEDWNCTFVIFDSRKAGNHPNCYLFHCPTNGACPTKPSAGVTSHRLTRDTALPGNSHSKAKDSKPTYVDGNKKNELFLALQHPEPINQAEPLAAGSSKNKSITSKILVLAEDIVNHLDKIDQSLQEEKGQEEGKKKDSKPSPYQKPGIFFQLATTAAATKIRTTTQATTSTTTTTLTTTTTTLSTTTTTTIPTTPLMATTPRPTPPPKPKTTSKPTTTTTPLPSTTTTPLPTTTTTTATTTLPITTSKITSLPTTTSTTLTTTTSTTTRLTTTSTTTTEPPLIMALTTTPVLTTTKHPFVKLRPANSHLSKTTSSEVISLTSTAGSRIPSPDVRPQDPLPKTRNSTAEGASKINVSAPITPFVGVGSVTTSQNFNPGLNGYEKKIVEHLPSPDSKTGDRSGLLAALVFGVLFFAVVVFLITRRALEAMRRRHYSRLDYLINGMYIDS